MAPIHRELGDSQYQIHYLGLFQQYDRGLKTFDLYCYIYNADPTRIYIVDCYDNDQVGSNMLGLRPTPNQLIEMARLTPRWHEAAIRAAECGLITIEGINQRYKRNEKEKAWQPLTTEA
jgi:hypothetical protein